MAMQLGFLSAESSHERLHELGLAGFALSPSACEAARPLPGTGDGIGSMRGERPGFQSMQFEFVAEHYPEEHQDLGIRGLRGVWAIRTG